MMCKAGRQAQPFVLIVLTTNFIANVLYKIFIETTNPLGVFPRHTRAYILNKYWKAKTRMAEKQI